MKRPAGIALLMVMTMVGLVAPAAAEDTADTQSNRYLGDRWNVRLFGSLSELSSDVSAGRELGAIVNLEKLLGFDENHATWSIDAFYRFTKNSRHTIRFAYIDYTRDA